MDSLGNIWKHITACTVVQAVVKADSQKKGKFRPPWLQNPQRDLGET